MLLGRLDVFEGNYAAGRAQCAEALALVREVGDAWAVWNSLHAVALAALAEDDLATARAVAYEALNLKADPTWQTRELHILGQIAIADGEYAVARGQLIQGLAHLANRDEPVATAEIVETLGHLASCVGQSDVALRLAAAAQAARDTLGVMVSRAVAVQPQFPLSRHLRDRWLIPLKRKVHAEDATRWWAQGYTLSLDEAVALAESLPLAAVSSAGVWELAEC